MTCKEAEKMIPLFLEDDLDTDDLKEVLDHIDHCEECKEELSIQFLVTEGLSRLETGNVFDLKNELRHRRQEAGRALKRREGMQWLLYAMEGLVAVAAIVQLTLLWNLF